MCEKCGCSDVQSHRHNHPPGGAHAHAHGGAAAHAADELSRNDRLAERNRGFFSAKHVFVVDLLSFSGSNVKAFIARTVADCGPRLRIRVVTGDFLEQIHAIHDHSDAHEQHAAPATTEEHIHLDAHAIAHALDRLDLDATDIVLLQNGGSAASQAVYDLGETVRVALFSVRDGAHKPLKFPLFFEGAAAVVINETDLIAATGFELTRARTHLAQVAPGAQVFEAAPATGEGMAAWYEFLEHGVKRAKA